MMQVIGVKGSLNKKQRNDFPRHALDCYIRETPLFLPPPDLLHLSCRRPVQRSLCMHTVDLSHPRSGSHSLPVLELQQIPQMPQLVIFSASPAALVPALPVWTQTLIFHPPLFVSNLSLSAPTHMCCSARQCRQGQIRHSSAHTSPTHSEWFTVRALATCSPSVIRWCLIVTLSLCTFGSKYKVMLETWPVAKATEHCPSCPSTAINGGTTPRED